MVPTEIVVGLIVVILFTVVSTKFRLLTPGGMVAALVVGTLVTLFGGLTWLSLLLVFHLAAAILTRFHYETKFRKGTAELKGGARSWTNVFANGGIAAVFAVFQGAAGGGIFFGGFLGALSSAASDTLATEVGTLYPGEPRLITKLKQSVRPGTSGALSPYGEGAILFAAALMGVVAAIMNIENWSPLKTLVIAIVAGFVGSTADSLLGATVQARYRCGRCQEETEANPHTCNSECQLMRGIPLLNNHSVNLISTLVGGLVGVVLAASF